jgi:protein involved in polysaccharide export with SLBB domain
MDRATLQSQLISFDLGKLVMDHDSTQDLELQPGDVVSVFSQSDIRVPIDEQTKFVHIEGEFVHSGVYSVRPGETLRDLVRRTSGLSEKAYLYGSIFTRESTRIAQQKRLDETTQQLSLQMQRGSLALASAVGATQQDLAGVSAAQATERDLIAELKQIRATGRIVLEFSPTSHDIDSVPDIPLENGDQFFVPSRPATINVVGAVFNQNSFLYRQAERSGAYLRLAGGPNSDADRRRMFIVRADGSVISRTSMPGGPWHEHFDNLHMYPGDTVVVPEKSLRPTALRGLIDWTQIFSQLALGAAAINVLK